MKNILIINGHPDKESFNNKIFERYISIAKNAGANVRSINIRELHFNPNLQYGYRKRTELESDLVNAWKDIEWSDHQVWIHPTWWLGMPAQMKGFIDRVFLPGFVIKKQENGKIEGMLQGKTAHIITTGDMTEEEYNEIYALSGIVQLKKGILEYCGINPVEVTFIGVVNQLTDKEKESYLEKIASIVLQEIYYKKTE